MCNDVKKQCATTAFFLINDVPGGTSVTSSTKLKLGCICPFPSQSLILWGLFFQGWTTKLNLGLSSALLN